MGNKKVLVAVGLTGGLLALGGTAVAFAGDRDSDPVPAAEIGHRTDPAPDQIPTGPRYEHDDPWPEHCSTEDPPIRAERAERIALGEVPGADVTGIDLDRCYGLEWEVDLRRGAAEYEVQVDARGGQVVEFDQDEDHDLDD
ncbi:PepSY domain-containing protein [Saccharopolyspora griseoalba]|uniref:PepSY domain-containing protein n=1 Tax=Saccharopolyspora griseoalba TaxID=1431848 RepID=A0ABW2LLV5_9PSEU